MSAPLGVGIIAAGPVTQAIHLPTLARLTDQYRVVHVMDIDGTIAEKVAGRAGAKSSTSVEAVMADPEVDVVAICSPPQFHSEQVLAAIAARKRGILCEKPFAVSWDEVETLAAAARQAGIPLLVAAMHAFDPGWEAVAAECGELIRTAHTVRSSISLPMNDRFEDLASHILSRPPLPEMNLDNPEVRAGMFRAGILGLAIHDLPIVRAFAPTIEFVDRAEVLSPFGYSVSAHSGHRKVSLFGHMHFGWKPEWTFDAWSESAHLHIDFTPSYVHAGSATALLTENGSHRGFGPFTHNGYTAEWIRLADMIASGTSDIEANLSRYIDDLTYALRIADAFTEATPPVSPK